MKALLAALLGVAIAVAPAFDALETDIRHSLEFVRTPGMDLRFADIDDSPGVESWDN